MNYSINECVFRSSSPVQKSFTPSLIKRRCVSFSKTKIPTNTPPFRHSKECAFHQIRLILLKTRYENPFSINQQTPEVSRTLLCPSSRPTTARNLEGLQRVSASRTALLPTTRDRKARHNLADCF